MISRFLALMQGRRMIPHFVLRKAECVDNPGVKDAVHVLVEAGKICYDEY